MQEYTVIGLMSGTSMDGLDIACCQFKYNNKQWAYSIHAADCIPYSSDWKDNLQQAHRLSGLDLLQLHKLFGFYLAEHVDTFISKNRLKPQLIASHGHSIFHDPNRALSFQLGDGAAISAASRLPVVSDFRALDVCAGGHGAPLVPIGDRLLFNEYSVCLNLGGIANISYDAWGQRLAYDVSPCNLVLNKLAARFGKEYDENGDLARQGRIIKGLVDELNSWPYYQAVAPKSLDKETLLNDWQDMLFSTPHRAEDLMTTFCTHIGMQVANAISQASTQSGIPEKFIQVLATGGGAFNTYLIEQIRDMSPAQIMVPAAEIVNYKEALIFAFLGVLRLRNEPNCLQSVTGAKYDNVGGALYGNFAGLA